MSSETTIVLVEDDKMISEMYMLKFKAEGFVVYAAEDGKTGVELVREKKPRLVLLDIILPKMDGFSALKMLKSDPEVANIPVVLLTNLGQDGDVRKGLDLGAVDYLVKANFTPSQVIEKIKKFIS